MRNIDVLGWFNHGNLGDEAYKLALPILFADTDLNFITHPKNIRKNTDLVIVGGGDVVKKDFLKNLHELKIPKVAASVTITEGSDLENLYKFDQVIVRDVKSLELAGKIHKRARLAPDFTFALTPDKEHGKTLLNSLLSGARSPKTVVVVLNSYIAYNSDEALARDVNAFSKLIHELARIIEDTTGANFIFLPFSTQSPWDDRAMGAWIGNRCKKSYKRNKVIYDILSVQDTLDIIAASDAVISTRLHSSIFSTLSCVPFIDILHHDKNYGFVKTVDVTDWATWLWQLDSEKVRNLLAKFLTDSLGNNIRRPLQNYTNSAKKELLDVASSLL